VFADKGEDDKAKQYTRWLTSSLIGARVKGEQWCQVKSERVVKQCALDQEVNDGKILNKDFAKNFKAICSKGHRRDECMKKDSPKCPACGDAHTVFDRACKLHLQ
jgi:hypothetical protein